MSDTPYRSAAYTYWEAGWRGVLPVFEREPISRRILPHKTKKLSERGRTGHDGVDPSYPDVHAWMEGSEGDHNIALRMPDGVLGIDVDNYGKKRGAETLARCEADWGPLPRTWRSSARPLPSGIRFFRVPLGLGWPGGIPDDIEIIQRSHRYAVVWPSWNPDSDSRYTWYQPNGALVNAVPRIDDLAELPAEWVDRLSTGLYAPDRKAAITDAGIIAALDQWDHAGTCRVLRHAVLEVAADFRHGARHETLNGPLLRIVRLAERGHCGLRQAIADVKAAFLSAATDPTRGRSRSDSEAASEWRRAVSGAVAIVTASPEGGTPCSCDIEISDLIPPELPDPATPHDGAVPSDIVAEPLSPPVGVETPGSGSDAVQEHSAPSLLALEVQRLRRIREANRALDAEEAAALFRVPTFTRNLREELALPRTPTRYLIPEIMPSNANSLLTAQFKAGKTTLINNVTKSLVDGMPLFGKLQPQFDGRVGIFNYEVDREQYAQWLEDMRIENQEAVSVLPLRGYSLPLLAPHVQEWTVRWLSEHEISVWIIDPYARAAVGSIDDENNNAQASRLLDLIDVIKSRAGVQAVIMPTHTGRAEMGEGQERARGATRLDDWADVRWLLTRDAKDQRYFRATGRDVDFPETHLVYDAATRQLSLGAGNRSAVRSVEVQDAIMAVTRHTPGVSTTGLRDGVRELLGSVSQEAFDSAKGILKRAGKLRAVQDGRAVAHYLARQDDLESLVPDE